MTSKQSIFFFKLQIKSLVEPKSISIDWINYRLYIIDGKSNSIISSNLRGDFIVTVVSTLTSNALNLVVNPVTRFVQKKNYFSKPNSQKFFIPDQFSGQQKKLVYTQLVWMVQ